MVSYLTIASSASKIQFRTIYSKENKLFSCFITGSGNWGSAIAKIVGHNCKHLDHCIDRVNMWVYEETVETSNGRKEKLTEIINREHENVKYLPGIKLPSNVIAEPDLAKACKGATLLIFVLPHQFLPKLLPTIRENIHPSCRGVSLIKGLGKRNVSGIICFRGHLRF